jgi:hypothetical protein
MMLSVPIAAFSTSLASASPMAGAGLIGNTGALLSGAVSTFPYNQGFESGQNNNVINEANWGSNQWTYRGTNHSGSHSAGAAITTTGDDTRRLFVNVNFSGKACTSISYWYKITSTDTTVRYMRLIGSTNSTNGQDGSWFVLRDWTNISNATSWTQFSANQNLSNFSNKPNCYIKLQVKNMSGHNQRTLYVDDFHIDAVLMVPPSLVSPANGQTNVNPCPTFVWGQVSSPAIGYNLQVSWWSNFCNTVIDIETSSTSYTSSFPLWSSTTYYWRVRTKYNGAYSGWSGVWSFTTEPLLRYVIVPDTVYQGSPFTVSVGASQIMTKIEIAYPGGSYIEYPNSTTWSHNFTVWVREGWYQIWIYVTESSGHVEGWSKWVFVDDVTPAVITSWSLSDWVDGNILHGRVQATFNEPINRYEWFLDGPGTYDGSGGADISETTSIDITFGVPIPPGGFPHGHYRMWATFRDTGNNWTTSPITEFNIG